MSIEVGNDAADFDGWVRPHLAAMGALAARLTSRDDRDDIVQEALALAWAKRSQFDAGRGSERA